MSVITRNALGGTRPRRSKRHMRSSSVVHGHDAQPDVNSATGTHGLPPTTQEDIFWNGASQRLAEPMASIPLQPNEPQEAPLQEREDVTASSFYKNAIRLHSIPLSEPHPRQYPRNLTRHETRPRSATHQKARRELGLDDDEPAPAPPAAPQHDKVPLSELAKVATFEDLRAYSKRLYQKRYNLVQRLVDATHAVNHAIGEHGNIEMALKVTYTKWDIVREELEKQAVVLDEAEADDHEEEGFAGGEGEDFNPEDEPNMSLQGDFGLPGPSNNGSHDRTVPSEEVNNPLPPAAPSSHTSSLKRTREEENQDDEEQGQSVKRPRFDDYTERVPSSTARDQTPPEPRRWSLARPPTPGPRISNASAVLPSDSDSEPDEPSESNPAPAPVPAPGPQVQVPQTAPRQIQATDDFPFGTAPISVSQIAFSSPDEVEQQLSIVQATVAHRSELIPENVHSPSSSSHSPHYVYDPEHLMNQPSSPMVPAASAPRTGAMPVISPSSSPEQVGVRRGLLRADAYEDVDQVGHARPLRRDESLIVEDFDGDVGVVRPIPKPHWTMRPGMRY